MSGEGASPLLEADATAASRLRHEASSSRGSSIVVDVVAESDEDPLEPHAATIRTQNAANASQSESHRLSIGGGFCVSTRWFSLSMLRVPGAGPSSVPA